MITEQIQNLINTGDFHGAAYLSKLNAIDALQMAALLYSRAGSHLSVEIAKICINLEPDSDKLYANLSFLQGNLMQCEEALESINKAINISPNVNYYRQKAILLASMKKAKEAVETYKLILKTNPDDHSIKFNIGCNQMTQGNYKEGLELLESRLIYDQELVTFTKRFNKPFWDGRDIKGKRLLIFSEQGVGDVIQFIRYLPRIKDVTLIGELQEELVPLVKDFFDITIGRSADFNVAKPFTDTEYDYVISFSSLPYLLDPELKDIPPCPYLFGNSRFKVDKLKFNVGVVWAGNPLHPNDVNRSCHPAYFMKLLEIENIQLYNLQKDKNVEGIISCELNNFQDTADVIKELDLVISVDTAVAHLAGAMNKRVFLLLPYCHDHRWLLNDSKSPWYPSMKIFHQKKAGEWRDLLDEVYAQTKPSGIKESSF
jgi:tetratricopeptide (TPR) repeat protein